MADLGPFHQNEGTPRPRARNLNKCVIIVQEHITPNDHFNLFRGKNGKTCLEYDMGRSCIEDRGGEVGMARGLERDVG